jgi:hypothetical protein
MAGIMQLVVPLVAHGQQAPIPSGSVVAENYGKLPLSFEANQGQSDPQVKFQSRGSGYSLFLTDSSAVLALTKQNSVNAKSSAAAVNGLKTVSAPQAGKTDVVRMNLAGASHSVRVTGVNRLPGKANYFIGNDPAKWLSDMPTYAKVQYTGVYPGVDLVYYGNQQQLEYDFVIAPGANPEPIRLQFAGAKKLKLTADGDLRVAATNGEIAFHKPVIYQIVNGQRQMVRGQFSLLAKNTVGFNVAQYDHTKALVIDPVLAYSTYFGTGIIPSAIAVDSSGNVYITGESNPAPGTGLPSGGVPVTTGAFQTVSNGKVPPNLYGSGAPNAYVTKLNPTGSALIYSTYLGGSNGDQGTGIAVDGAGNAYVTGVANSTDFPVTAGAFQTTNRAAGLDTTYTYTTANNSTETVPIVVSNAFIAKLNPAGTALVYSTYLGGSGVTYPWVQACVINGINNCPPYDTAGDYASSIAIDSSGNAYVTGTVNSTDFPLTSGAFQTVNHSPGYRSYTFYIPSNAFVTKLNASGTALVFSTYLGGSGYYSPSGTSGYSAAGEGDAGNSIAVDSAGNSYITGSTYSADFPVTSGAFQAVNNAANAFENAFITKLNPTGTALIYSTYLGGSNSDYGSAIVADGSGDAYVTGKASSINFPISVNAFQTINNAAALKSSNAFVTKLNSTGTGLQYSTYLGGSDNGLAYAGDYGTGIAVDGSGNAYVTGYAYSTNFPVTAGAYQAVNNAATLKLDNAFVAKLNSAGTGLLYSTYLGGSGSSSADTGDYGIGITVDGSDNAYVVGIASSSNFPITAGAYQTTLPQYYTSPFIAKLNLSNGIPSPTVTVTPSSSTITASQALMVTVVVNSASGSPTPTGSVTLTGGGYTSGAEPLSSGSVTIDIPADSLATGVNTLTATYTPDSSSSSTYDSSTGTSSVTVTTPTVTLSPTSLTFAAQTTGSTSVAQTITLMNSGTAALTITSISASGDFAETQTCGSSVATGATCAISVAFTPTAAGSRTGTLTITDNAGGSPQTVALSGTGTPPAVAAPAVTLSPTSLTFASQTDGSTSVAQTITLTNSGTAALSITSISTSGDFAETQTCGSSVATGATCTISVTFSPTAAGSRTGALTITDNASGSPQTVALSGTGTSSGTGTPVTVSTTSTGMAISSPGGTSTATIQLTPAGGFTGTVNLTCSVLYQGQGSATDAPTCSFSPAQASITGSAAVSSTLTVSTTAASGSARLGGNWTSAGRILAAFLFLGLVPRRRWRGMALLALLCIIAASALVGCGGGGSAGGGGTTPPANPGTTAGSYSVTVTATSGTVTASTIIPLSVQ